MDHPFKWRHYQPEVILLCVRWYLRYVLSYRDLAEMMAERGLKLDHTTIFRWVLRYVPEIDRLSRPVGSNNLSQEGIGAYAASR